MIIHDFEGNEATPAWLLAEFGGVELFEVDMPDGAWKLTDVYARRGCQMPAGMEVTAKRRDGSPADGLEVILWEEGTPNNVARFTNDAGLARFDVGQEQMYSVPGRGRWAVRVRKPNSDRLAGIGRVLTKGKAVPDKWLDLVFQFAVGDGPEPPPPPVEGVTFMDEHGYLASRESFEARFGPTHIETPPFCEWYVDCLVPDVSGGLEVVVAAGLEHEQVVWGYDSAPPIPGLEGARGEVWPTGADGAARFTMGPGGAYAPGQKPPPHWTYLLNQPSQLIRVGWVAFTNHEHFNIWYRHGA